jgi:hypothetical protein
MVTGAFSYRIWKQTIDAAGFDQLVFGRCLNRQVGGFLTIEDAIHVGSGARFALRLWLQPPIQQRHYRHGHGDYDSNFEHDEPLSISRCD